MIINHPFFILLKKEVRSYFSSPFTYFVVALFNFIVGWLFFNYLGMAKENPNGSITETVFIPFFGNLNFILLIFIPILTMRSISEERKNGTLDLLYKSRLTDFNLIWAKFLGLMILMIFMISFTLVFPVTLSLAGHTDWPVVLLSYLGIILALTVYVWIGVFSSSLTENQFIAAVITFVVQFSLMLLILSGNLTGNEMLIQLLLYISPSSHLGPFTYGFFKSYSFVYFVSGNIFFSYLTLLSLKLRRV